jgi:hypothetical protein
MSSVKAPALTSALYICFFFLFMFEENLYERCYKKGLFPYLDNFSLYLVALVVVALENVGKDLIAKPVKVGDHDQLLKQERQDPQLLKLNGSVGFVGVA